MSRRDRRNNDPGVLKKREQFAAPFGDLPLVAPGGSGYGNSGGGSYDGTSIDAGGYGVGLPGAVPAIGSGPSVNPFVIPKEMGLTHISQTYLSNYYVEWNPMTWRFACDQCMKMGYSLSYATLTSWAFESSPFIQMLFEKWGDALDEVEFYIVDQKGNRINSMQQEFCEEPWQMELRREMMWAFMWGFAGLNFDPYSKKVYKYPMQEVDPINRMLKSSTFAFYEGIPFAESDNLIFVQHSTNVERFLGLMQPITRSYIMMNEVKSNWVSAGIKLAFPVMTVGYPQNSMTINGQQQQINPYKLQAEDIARNINPGKGIVFPYTINSKGEIQKAVEVEFAETKAGNNMYKIYAEFNDDEKNEIRELILGGTLSSQGSKSGSGSRSLGEVHERMFKQVVRSKMRRVLACLNSDYVPKLSKFYTDLPKYWKYEVDRGEKMTMEEITALSSAVTANGYRLTPEFWEENGIAKEYLEDLPTPVPAAIPGREKPVKDPDPNVNMAKKKSWLERNI
jgi:hypothetical protein